MLAGSDLLTRPQRCQPQGFAGLGPQQFLTPVTVRTKLEVMQDYSVCLAKKSQVSAPPAAEQMVQPVPHRGDTAPLPAILTKLERTLAHRESRGSWSLPSCNFQLGFHLVLEDTGLLHAHHVQSVAAQGGDATGAPSSLHTEVAPARAWAKEVDALLFSSSCSQDQRDVKHSGRAVI